MSRLLAHTIEYANRANPLKALSNRDEGLVEHLLQAGAWAEWEASRLGREAPRLMPEARFAGLSHDIGKALMTDRSFKMPIEEWNRISHSQPGALLSLQHNFFLSSLSVLAHHAGLKDSNAALALNNAGKQEWLRKVMAFLETEASRFEAGLEAPLTTSLYRPPVCPSWMPTSDDPRALLTLLSEYCRQPSVRSRKNMYDSLAYMDENIQWFNDVRMVAGCLVRADHATTGFYIDGSEYGRRLALAERLGKTDWLEIREILLAAKKYEQSIATSSKTMSKIRDFIQGEVAKRAPLAKDMICTLLSATGTGKTLALLLGAVEAMIASGCKYERIILAEPTISIMSQVYGKFRDWDKHVSYYGEESSRILGTLVNRDSRVGNRVLPRFTGPKFYSYADERLGGENWDYFPIIITSHVMLARALFSGHPIDTKFFPALANSIVLIDEADMLAFVSASGVPAGVNGFVNVREAVLCLFDDLARRYNCLPIFSSATMFKPTARKNRREADMQDSSHNDLRPRKAHSWLRFDRHEKISLRLSKRVVPVRRADLTTPAQWAAFAATKTMPLVKVNTKALAQDTFDALSPIFDGKTCLLYGNKLSRHNIMTLISVRIMSFLRKPKSLVEIHKRFELLKDIDEQLTRLIRRGDVSEQANMFVARRIALVATSMGQNGIDMSFSCGIEQIASMGDCHQLPGRVNRHGEFRKGELFIVGTADENKNFHSQHQHNEAEEFAKDVDRLITTGRFFSPRAFRKISEENYIRWSWRGMLNPLLRAIADGRFDDAGSMGRLIDDSDVSIIIKANDSSAEVDEIIYFLDNNPLSLPMKFKILLHEHSIGMYEGAARKLLDQGKIRPFQQHSGMYLALPGMYDEEAGLRL